MRSARNGERTASEEGRAPRRLRLLAVALAFGLIAAACGGDDEDAVDSTAGDTGSSAGSSEPAEPAADDPDAADESAIVWIVTLCDSRLPLAATDLGGALGPETGG